MNLETLYDILASNKFGRWVDSGNKPVFIHSSVIQGIRNFEDEYIVEAMTPRTLEVLENLFHPYPDVTIVMTNRN